MKLVTKQVTRDEIEKMAERGFGDMVKAVVDIKQRIMAVDMDLHADGEAELLKDGSRQIDLWGINLYPDLANKEWIEFRSMINVKPASGNNSLVVENPQVQREIEEVVNLLIKD